MSTADRFARSPLVDATGPVAQQAAPAKTSGFSLPASRQRELRLDLFRGLALWLIFIDHVSPDVLTWFTIRNYGFSDAAEIFIFISGYTAAWVYGRAMVESGFVIGAARIFWRVWQIYSAHILLFVIIVAEVAYATAVAGRPVYIEEMRMMDFFLQPGDATIQALLLRFRPLNMDVLPIYIVMMLFLPLVLRLARWQPDVPLAISIVIYLLTLRYDLHLSSYPDGFWSFNPFAWQLLFNFGAWCATGGVKRISWILSSRAVLWTSIAYLLAAFYVTLTWYFPQLDVIPSALERWIYPIDKTDLDVLRFAHFLALAVIAWRFVPAGWSGLEWRIMKPVIMCGQNSLQIFCLGVALAFAGYAFLTETNAGFVLNFVVGFAGILLMSAMAWLLNWYKRIQSKGGRAAAPAAAG